jgi:hypothetical protein
MNLRQRIQVWTLLILILFCFASYHQGSGGVGWLQWLTAISIFVFLLVFDLAFTNDSQFIFDPDADNWRRKVVSRSIRVQVSENDCETVGFVFVFCDGDDKLDNM